MLKWKHGRNKVVWIILDLNYNDALLSYLLYTACDKNPDYLDMILFDAQGYWIYDGEALTIAKTKQVAKFIMIKMNTLMGIKYVR